MRTRTILPAVATAAVLLTGCGGSSAPSGSSGADSAAAKQAPPSNEPGPPGRAITIAAAETPGSLDPAAGSGDGIALHQLIYDPLVHVDADGKVVSGLASSWKGDAKKLTFTLRKDATCADGTPVTPSLVARNFKRMEDPSLPVAALRLTTNTFTVDADDARSTISIGLDRPNTFFLQSLAQIYIVCPSGLDDAKLLTTKGSGSGPFTLKSSTHGDRYVLERRDGYTWGADGASTAAAGFPSQVTLRIVPNETTAANLLLGGGLDVGVFQGQEVQRVQAGAGDKLRTQARKIRTESLLFNQKPGRPTASPAVRKALTMVLDRAAFAQVLTGDFGGPATGVAGTEPLVCAHDATSVLPRGEADEAQRLLADDGWTPGPNGTLQKDGKALQLTALFPPPEGAAFEYVQGVWKQLGVELALDPQPTAAINQELVGGGNWDVTALYPPSSFPSAVDTLVTGAAPPKGTNVGRVENADYDALSARAKRQDGADGCAAWEQAERALYAAADIVPMAQRQALWAWNRDVGFEPRGTVNAYSPMSLRSPAK